MANVTIYTTRICPYCISAKRLLAKKGVSYQEVSVDTSDEKYNEMMARSGGRRTVPQIFIGDFHVGGSDDLHTLDRAGKLDELLRG